MKKTCLLLTAALTMASINVMADEIEHGWNAEYWMGATNFDQPEGPDFQNAGKRPAGTVATLEKKCIEPVIDFEWGSNGSPCNPDEAEYNDPAFCCKWTGYLLAPETSYYTFDCTHWDDGFSFTIYDIDDLESPLAHNEFWNTWGWDKPEWTVNDVELEKGHVYFLDVRHYENEFGAHARLCWFCEDIHTSKEVLPAEVMYVSNPLQSGVESVVAAAKINIKGNEGSISVNGAEGLPVAVYNLQGVEVFAGAGNIDLPVAAGLYVVTAGNETAKVLVK